MKNDRSLAGRVYILITVMGLWGAAIGTRLYFLHVVHSAGYRHRAERQQQRTLEVNPRRGNIYDRNGNELAVSIKVDSVFAVPDEIKNPAATAKALSAAMGIPKDGLLRKFDTERNFVWLKRKLDPAEAAAIQKAKLPGIYFQKEDRRYYPKRSLASHVLGYVNIDEEGLGGLEYRYNDSVRGGAGRILIMTDARGRSFNSVEQPVTPGANLVTTIDQNIQYIVEKELEAAVQQLRPVGASIVAMAPETGEILAMANYPAFNPNEYARYTREAWVNRAVSHAYEPGSTFKIVTIASALEEGLANPAEVIDCQMGAINVFGRVVHDWKRFGLLTVTEIMQNSSDVGAIKLAMRVGDERFSEYIARLGFGTLSAIDLPGEERGLSKPASRWTRSSVGSIAMGQEIGVTPLQVVRMVAAVANGGILYRPFVVKKVEHRQKGILSEPEPHGERVLSVETAARLHDMLEVVVTDGTAKSGKLEGYTAAGKTGTAQKIDETGRYSQTKHVASFAGFAPASNPRIALIVMLDEPVYGQHHGGQAAAPIFKRISEQVLRYLSVPPDAPSYAPRYTVKPEPKKDEPMLVQAGAWASAVRAHSFIPVSSPAMDAPPLGGVQVPDFRGKSLREVTEQTLNAGLRLQSIGSGAAVEQMPPPGASVSAGTPVRVRFSTRVGGK